MTRILAIGGLVLTFAMGWVGNTSVRAADVGATVEPFTLNDFRGATVHSTDFKDVKCLVVSFLGTECPLAKLYGPRLQQLAKEYEPQGAKFLSINANQQDSIADITAYVKELGIEYPILKDPGQKVADLFGAVRTPEVFVISPLGVVLYRGRVDDQYIVGVQRKAAERQDLRVALDEILAGKPVSVARTEPIGCLIGRVRQPKKDATVTWSNQIVRLVQTHCVDCHRPGEIGPFSLLSYDDAQGWGDMIAEVVADRRMPPWHADAAHGKFANDTSLTTEERELILTWVKDGCPEGDKSQLPPTPTFVEGWQLSKAPDAVFEMDSKPFSIPADAGPRGVKYQYFMVDPKFDTDKWVTEVEAVPSNRAVVHHIIVFVASPDQKKGVEGDFLCAYVPGARTRPAQPGQAKKIKAGSMFKFQVHYTPNGSPQEDLSKVGMIFADEMSVTHEVRTTEVINTSFRLEPEKDNQSFTAKSRPSPIDLSMISLAPHMHLRGKAFKYELELPDGTRQVVLNVPRYDFNWQTNYLLSEPVKVPQGARMVCTAVYDNSRNNPANPDPTREVGWGDQSWDEMMLGYFDVIVPRGSTEMKSMRSSVGPEMILRKFDKDKDKKISKEESKEHDMLSKGFIVGDTNRDGFLDEEELDAVIEKFRKITR
jgi:peroxiredoxin